MRTSDILPLWQRLDRWPGGRRLFSFLIGRTARYSGSIGARVESLDVGKSVLVLRDRRRVRNHLGSIHAIALANLGELASGLAMMAALPIRTRGIVVSIRIEYIRKARGQISAAGSADPGEILESVERLATATLTDASGEVVARSEVTWRLSPEPAVAE